MFYIFLQTRGNMRRDGTGTRLIDGESQPQKEMMQGWMYMLEARSMSVQHLDYNLK